MSDTPIMPYTRPIFDGETTAEINRAELMRALLAAQARQPQPKAA